jgi:hypothetical protein
VACGPVGQGQLRSERAARREVEPLDMSLVPEVVLPEDMVLVSVDEPLVTVVVPATGALPEAVPDELVLLGMLDDVLLVVPVDPAIPAEPAVPVALPLTLP